MNKKQEIYIIDQTIRDAQQSLWGHLMTLDMIIPIAEVMDSVGYRAINLPGARGAVVQARSLKENVFDRYKLISQRIIDTPLRASFVNWDFSGFNFGPVAVIELWIKRAIAHGIKSFWFVNYQNMFQRENYLCKVAKKEGAEIVGALMYTQSPFHTEDVWALKIRRLVEMGVDVIQLEDTVGVLTLEDTRKLVKLAQIEANGLPFEFHTHCCTGMAPMCYVEALKNDVQIFHTSVSPLANGWSLPSTEQTIKNAKTLGFSVSLDEDALKRVSEHFRSIATERGILQGKPVEYDLTPYRHHIPGGMRGTMRNQLAEIKQEHRLEEVLNEAGRIREELGYPVGATPYSQFIGAQALFNVVSGDRYKVVSDEIIRYVLGHYGEADGPIDPGIKEKILSSSKAKKWINWKEPEITIEDIRKLAPGLSDDELLVSLLEPQSTLSKEVNELFYKRGV